jgi:hypothetical protein
MDQDHRAAPQLSVSGWKKTNNNIRTNFKYINKKKSIANNCINMTIILTIILAQVKYR